ncbi:MFS transporter [Consotaella aegiceratis]|uniref:MFS transporter n=1 Tax=Consotaella aegiceratis TaxID=3097961 RepID=UPI002F3EF1A5
MVASIGGAVCCVGVIRGSFVQFCIGALLFGLNIACVQSYRFAAGQAAPANLRARAISLVLLGGLGSAVIGPQIAIHAEAVWLGAPYASAFAGQVVFAALTIPFLAFLKLPGGHGLARPSAEASLPSRPGSGLRARFPVTRSYFIAVVCAAIAYGSMSFTMTAAPLAIVACGLGKDNAALGIQWHIIGMFAPSLITGRLIERFGHFRIMITGIAIVALGAAIALSSEHLAAFWVTLVLLGIGWNFAYTGSTVMIAHASAAAGAVTLQGLADFLIFAFVAAASLLSGAIFQLVSWAMINVVVLTALIGMMVLIWANGRRERTMPLNEP